MWITSQQSTGTHHRQAGFGGLLLLLNRPTQEMARARKRIQDASKTIDASMLTCLLFTKLFLPWPYKYCRAQDIATERKAREVSRCLTISDWLF